MARILLIVDPQNDFAESGSLAVAGGLAVGERITSWASRNRAVYDLVAVTRDWHHDPGTHFASATGDAPDFATTWPDHCVADTTGAEFIPTLNLSVVRPDVIVSKGQRAAAYSGFEGITADGENLATVIDAVAGHGPVEIDVCGIATDYCVRATALDAARHAHERGPVNVLLDLCVGVAADTTAQAVAAMCAAGIVVTTTDQLKMFRSTEAAA